MIMEKQTTDRQDPAAEPAAAAAELVIDLANGLEIKAVEETHRSLSAALERGVPLTIDMTRVGAVDTAGVQLLLGLQIEAAKRGMPIRLTGESAGFNQALNVLGLRERFNPAGTRG
jgi:anti-anti-sigma regulatory factor